MKVKSKPTYHTIQEITINSTKVLTNVIAHERIGYRLREQREIMKTLTMNTETATNLVQNAMTFAQIEQAVSMIKYPMMHGFKSELGMGQKSMYLTYLEEKRIEFSVHGEPKV